MKLSNISYDRMKWFALVFIPAFEVLILTLGKIWGFPYVVEIGSTIAAVDVFLGTLLGVSTLNYRAEKVQDIYNVDGIKMFDISESEVYENEDATDTAE